MSKICAVRKQTLADLVVGQITFHSNYSIDYAVSLIVSILATTLESPVGAQRRESGAWRRGTGARCCVPRADARLASSSRVESCKRARSTQAGR